MYSILLAVERPDVIEHEAGHKYDNIVNIFANLAKHNTNNQLIGEGVLLLEIDKGLTDVSVALHALQNFSYSYSILSEALNLVEVAPLHASI